MIARTDQPLPLPLGYCVEFEVPRPVASSKNRRRIFSVGGRRGRRGRRGRIVSLPSEQAEADIALLRQLARAASGGAQFAADDAIELSYEHNLRADTVRIIVRKIGKLPAQGPKGTRRDVHGMLETIADALQGVLYSDDRQVDAVACRRARA